MLTRRQVITGGLAGAVMCATSRGVQAAEEVRPPIFYLQIAARYMEQFGIAIRDTFSWDTNADDYYTNGCFGGPRRLKIEISDTAANAETRHLKGYEIPGRKCLAYDSSVIVIPSRFVAAGIDHPVVHESVHFLQFQTLAENNAYRGYDGKRDRSLQATLAYLGQRIEIEAFLVQVAFIICERPDLRDKKLDRETFQIVVQLIEEMKKSRTINRAIEVITRCQKRGLV